jgi:hypothetical protein
MPKPHGLSSSLGKCIIHTISIASDNQTLCHKREAANQVALHGGAVLRLL